MSFNFKKDVLTDSDLYYLANKLNVKLNGIFMKDELISLKNGNYIINLQNHNQTGSHWTSFIKKGKNIYYCDSYGMPMPQEELNLFTDLNDIIYWNNTQFQDINSKCCGYFALSFLLYFTKNKNYILNNYLKMFDYSNYKKNDLIVKNYIKKYLQ